MTSKFFILSILFKKIWELGGLFYTLPKMSLTNTSLTNKKKKRNINQIIKLLLES